MKTIHKILLDTNFFIIYSFTSIIIFLVILMLTISCGTKRLDVNDALQSGCKFWGYSFSNQGYYSTIYVCPEGKP